MEKFSEIIHYILHSNVINFIIMICILAAIIKKINLGKNFEKTIENVAAEIKKSDEEKEKYKKILDEAQEILDNLPQDIETIEKSSAEKTKAFKDSIEENTQKAIFNIDQNIKKSLAIEEKKISNLMTEKTSKASIELAKAHIQNLLNANPELHNKYILESLDELDKVKL